ncbi:MAG: DEAD/DEAH box helicase family protein [Muribaculaceae bacterium]|nr:DEAD/DEAH box helicase family protein [Muribaculaceae bacterium]MBQ7854629.1 DEAD/DEAH box helicase family protein [Muribaculaceae bacterium]
MSAEYQVTNVFDDSIFSLSEEDIKNRYITPSIESSGWTKNQTRMEFTIMEKTEFTDGKIIIKGRKAKRGNRKSADYLLFHKNNYPLAIVEAKDASKDVAHGIQQAIDYARILDVPFAYSSNGMGFVEHDMKKGTERRLSMSEFPTPEQLWNRYKGNYEITEEVEEIIKQPYFYREGINRPRYYQRIAINRTVEAVAKGQNRIMLVMATGTGKTCTAFQIIHRLYESKKVKKVLYLADRNILIDQTILNDFAPFNEKGILTKVKAKNLESQYDIYMSLYHQLSGDDDEEAFRQFKPEFFDLIVVDECHRGSAKENSRWRKILNYFNSAIHIGMTATPKETEEVSNIDYFGEPVYTYSLKQGIDDGFLAPYRVLRFGIDKDLEGYIPEVGKVDVNGQIIEHRVYTSKDFDRKLIIDKRTETVAKRITEYLKQTDRFSKTIVFCVDEEHALRMREALINENQDLVAQNDKYIMRITGSDDLGKQQLENFIDNNCRYPTIVTTSKLLSTGVDCKMVKLIVLESNINSMTEFKQIIGRGTRLVWDRDKRFFTIMDFRKATLLFSDPEFDGPATSTYEGDGEKPVPPAVDEDDEKDTFPGDDKVEEPEVKYRVNDVNAEIISTTELIYGPNGKLIANHSENFKNLILEKYATEDEFRNAWLNSDRNTIINDFDENGVDFNRFKSQIGNDVDVFDIIMMIGFNKDARLKAERVECVKESSIYTTLNDKQKQIVDELLAIYVQNDCIAIEKIDTLNLPNFANMGGLIPCAKIMGGKPKYLSFITELINKIYED